MSVQPVLTPQMQRQVADIARAAAKQALGGRSIGSLIPATVASYNPYTKTCAVIVDGDTVAVSASVLADGYDWYSYLDRVMVQFEPPQGLFVVGRIGPSNSDLVCHDDFLNAVTAWAGGVGLGDTPWAYTLAGHATVPFGGTGTGWSGKGYTGSIALQTGASIGFWTQIRKSTSATAPLPNTPLRFRGRWGVDGGATNVQVQGGVGDASTGVSPLTTGFYWRIRESAGGVPAFQLVSTAATASTVYTVTDVIPVNKTMYEFIVEWVSSSFVRGYIKSDRDGAIYGPYTITTNIPAYDALVNPLFGSAYPFANSTRYGVFDYLRLERLASLNGP